MKTCNDTQCSRINPQSLDQFSRHSGIASKLRGNCISCQSRVKKAYYGKNKAMFQGKVLARTYWPHLTWQEALAEYARLSSLQGGTCAICKKAESALDNSTGDPKRLAVDHVHGTSAVRGLLCQACNLAVGMLRDSPELCYAAGEYLKSGRGGDAEKSTRIVSISRERP